METELPAIPNTLLVEKKINMTKIILFSIFTYSSVLYENYTETDLGEHISYFLLYHSSTPQTGKYHSSTPQTGKYRDGPREISV